MASSVDSTYAPTDPIDLCFDFFEQKSAVNAQIHFLQTLTATFRCAISVSAPLAIALFHGNFLWDYPDSPNNFRSLLFGKPPLLASTGNKEAMMLHLKAKKGGDWSDKNLDHVIHQAISIPLIIDATVHTLHNFSAASEIFFEPDSLITAGLRFWHEAISFNLTCYESQAVEDPSFITKIISAVDTCVNYWLTECSMAAL